MPAKDLEPYLGALAHLVAARAGAQNMTHTHGGGEEYANTHAVEIMPGYSGPKI